MVSTRMALLCLYSAVLITSINGVFAKTIPLDAVTVTQLRCALAALALAVFASLRKSSLYLQSSRHYWAVLLLGVLMAVHWSAFFKGMQVATVAIGILAHYTYPVFTVILEPLLDKRAPAARDMLAAIVVLGGVALMVPDWNLGSSALYGVAFGVLSAMCFSARNVLQRRWVRGESSAAVMFYQVLIVALVTLPFADLTAVNALDLTGWKLVLALALIGTALSHSMVATALRGLSAKTVSLIGCLQPPAAIALSWLLLSEVPHWQTLLGGGLILAAALYESLRLKKPDGHQSQ